MTSIIKPFHYDVCKNILNSKQSLLITKTAPKKIPLKVYMYCCPQPNKKQVILTDNTLQQCKVIGEFVCNKIDRLLCTSVPYQKENNLGYGHFLDNGVYSVEGWHEGIVCERSDKYIDSMLNNDDLNKLCLTAQDVFDYVGIYKHFYIWYISDVIKYAVPKELYDFRKPCNRIINCSRCEYNEIIWEDEQNTFHNKCARPTLNNVLRSWEYVEQSL